MSTKARHRFDENCEDVERLLAIHKDIAGDAPGRKYGVEVLNKSAIVLICAFWEAYLEDLADEALDAVTNGVADFTRLPMDLRKHLAKAVKTSPIDLSPWDLAGTGWQTFLRNNLAGLKQKYLEKWNTPKSYNIKVLYSLALGMADVTASWKRPYLSNAIAIKRLDDFVTLRGAIAHRGKSRVSVTKWAAQTFLSHVKELVTFTDEAVNNHVAGITGKPLF
jgi:hypothetical protein